LVLQNNNKYNGLANPPDLEFARLHGQAKRTSEFIDFRNYEGRICPCCGYAIDNQ
jgi:hypothetical protein